MGPIPRRSAWCVAVFPLLASVWVGGCRRDSTSARRAPLANASASAPAAASAVLAAPSSSGPPRGERLPALAASADLIELPVPGHRAAVLSVPAGATSSKPSVIVIHGESDEPERPCAVWRRIVGPSAFVLCPRGAPREDPTSKAERFIFSGTEAVAEELRGGLAALKARYGAHVAAGPVVLVGYSQGAAFALAIGLQEPSFFSRLVLVDGGYDRFTASVATRYAERGGRRVLFACGRVACRDATQGSVHLAERGGVQARRVYAPGARLASEGPLTDLVVREIPWLLGEDDRFSVNDGGSSLGGPAVPPVPVASAARGRLPDAGGAPPNLAEPRP